MAINLGDRADGNNSWPSRVNRALMPDYNRVAATYWWAMVALGTAVFAWASYSVSLLAPAQQLRIGCGVVLAMLAAGFPVRIPRSTNSFAAGEIFIFLLLLLYGPGAASIAAAGEGLVGALRTSKRWTSRIISPLMACIAMMSVGTLMLPFINSALAFGPAGAAVMLIATTACALLHFLLVTTLIVAIPYLKRRQWPVLKEVLVSFSWVGVTFGASGCIACLLSIAFDQTGVGVLFAAVPIITMLLIALHYYFREQAAADLVSKSRVEAAEREAELAADHIKELRQSEQRFHSAFTHASIGMALVGFDGRLLQANSALRSLLGFDANEPCNRYAFGDFVCADDSVKLQEQLKALQARQVEAFEIELRLRGRDGREVWGDLHGSLFAEDFSDTPCLILQVQDVTARRIAEANLQHIAFHDSLTGLPNRWRFLEQLGNSLSRANLDKRRHFALMFLDFDRFKTINDSLGHAAGDEFLVAVARRIQLLLRPHDIVARLGGDEFAILVEDFDGPVYAETLAERMIEALSKPLNLHGNEVAISASVGITYSNIGYVPKAAGHLDLLPELLAALLRRHRSRGLLDSVDSKREHRVLYIEPNAMDVELAIEHFAQAAPDLRLHAVASADQALSLLGEAACPFDLVLTDLRLSGMNAMELIRETQHRGMDLPFVIITGRGDETTAVALLRLGAYDYIVKRDNYLLQLPHSLRHALHRFQLDITTRALQSELIALNASLEQKVAQRTAQLQTEMRARLQAQQDLQHSEDLLKMAGRMARLGAWMIELPQRRMVWSEELAAICEVEVDRIPSVDEAIGCCTTPWRATLRRRLESCISDGAPFDEELQIISARSRLVWVRVLGQAVRGADSTIVRVQGTIQDITERKQAEADRQELEGRLRESQKLEAIGTFAGGIAHDFNNMLGAILGNVSLARDEVDADHPLQITLTQVHRTAVRGRSLVQQILAFSRRQPQAFVVQPLRPLIEEAVGMLRPMLPAMVCVETTFAGASAWVNADSTQIHQVLINLCVNAWHAMQGSTGCIQIGLEVIDDAAGAPPASAQGPRAHLWVRDNGSGMDAETRTRIFEPFFTTKSGHGTGLGLAVVHGIVLAHRGSISVDSTVGRGSTFHLLFPLAPEPADEGPAWLPSARGELPSAEGRHVLYVDDDEVMTLMVERLLQRNGYRVSAFQDAPAALEVVKADPHSFDVAVCDFNMPVLSGLDFARALASIRPQLPVIISSGHLPEEAQVEALRLGVRGLLQKQNTFDELDRLIRRVLANPSPESA